MTRAALPLIVLLAAACSDGQSNLVGPTEPFRVRNAQFVSGALPGSAPETTPFAPGDPPRIATLTVAQNVVFQGFAGKKITGKLSPNAAAYGLALKGVGSGYWLQPAGDLDTAGTEPLPTLNATADFGEDVPVGPAVLLGVAFDASGHAGPRYEQKLCIASSGPAGAADCLDAVELPAAAISLTWDTEVDLDLQVLTPDGKLVTPKHPFIDEQSKTAPADTNSPHIDRDSNPNCVIDGARRESLIWPAAADPDATVEPSGIYGIYVNLFNACGQQAVRFHVRVTTAVPNPDAETGGAGGSETPAFVEHVWLDQAGELVASQVTPSAPTGLFVTEFNFQ